MSNRKSVALVVSRHFPESDFEQRVANRMKDYAEPIIPDIKDFKRGEFRVNLSEKIEKFGGKGAVILQTVGENLCKDFVCLAQTIDASVRGGVSNIVLGVSHDIGARAERSMEPGDNIPYELYNTMLASAGGKVPMHKVVFDVHSEGAANSKILPTTNISSKEVLLDGIKGVFDPKNLVVLSPDFGGYKRAESLANKLGCKTAVISKNRAKDGHVKISKFFGNVKGKDVLIVDDMLDTGGSMIQAVDSCWKRGAKSVSIAVPHFLLNGDAVQKLCAAKTSHIFTTNAVNIPEAKRTILTNGKDFRIFDCTEPFVKKINQLVGLGKE